MDSFHSNGARLSYDFSLCWVRAPAARLGLRVHPSVRRRPARQHHRTVSGCRSEALRVWREDGPVDDVGNVLLRLDLAGRVALHAHTGPHQTHPPPEAIQARRILCVPG